MAKKQSKEPSKEPSKTKKMEQIEKLPKPNASTTEKAMIDILDQATATNRLIDLEARASVIADRTSVALKDLESKKEAAKTAKRRLEGCQEEEHSLLCEIGRLKDSQCELPFGKSDQEPVPADAQNADAGKKSTKAQQAAQKAEDTPPAEELVETAIEILQGLRRHKDGKKVVATKGIGAHSLAKRLFGAATAELKARALTILEGLEGKKVVARVEGSNKEPSFYPMDPAESAERF